MKSATVAPSLVLDEEGFELAKMALRNHAPEKVDVFTWKWFTDISNWFMVPDVEHPELPFYKAEAIIKHGPPYAQTIKLNYWLYPDLRRDGAPMPHSHPWGFTGNVLKGGYTEDRYEVSGAGVLLENPKSKHDLGTVSISTGVMHQAGTANEIPVTTFHEVTEILEPGTLSLMDCGLGVKEGWGYLDPDTGLYVPNKLSPTDPKFAVLARERNPHRYKKK